MSLGSLKMDSVFCEIWEQIGHHTVNMTKKLTRFTLQSPIPWISLSSSLQHSLWKSGYQLEWSPPTTLSMSSLLTVHISMLKALNWKCLCPLALKEDLATGGHTFDYYNLGTANGMVGRVQWCCDTSYNAQDSSPPKIIWPKCSRYMLLNALFISGV